MKLLTNKKLIIHWKRLNCCPICHTQFPEGDFPAEDHMIVEAADNENVVIQVCGRHYVDPRILQESRNQYLYSEKFN